MKRHCMKMMCCISEVFMERQHFILWTDFPDFTDNNLVVMSMYQHSIGHVNQTNY